MNTHRAQIALLALLLAGTTSHAFAGDADAPAAAENDTSRDAENAEKAEPTLTLIEVGEEPRRELRYSRKPLAGQRIVLSVRSTLEQTAAGMPVPATRMPVSRFTLESSIEEGEGDDEGGDIRGTFRYVDAEVMAEPAVPPRVIEIMRQSANQLKGRSAKFAITTRGQVRSLELDDVESGRAMSIGADTVETIRQTLRDAITMFPEEPVGVGAKWRVKATTRADNLEAMQEVTYTITRMDEDAIEVSVQTSQKADPQPMEMAGRPQRMNVVSYKMSGTGAQTIALDKLLPVQAERETRTEMELEIVGPAGSQTLTQKVETSVQIERAEEDDTADERDQTADERG